LTSAVFGDFLGAGRKHLEAVVAGQDRQDACLPAVVPPLHRLVTIMSLYLEDLAPCDDIEAAGRTDLHVWERALDLIKDRLAGSDPQLAALLTTFTRLARDEEMPAQEEILAGSRWTIPCSSRRPRRRRAGARRRPRSTPGRVGVQWAVLLLWLLTTAVLITVAVVLSRGGGSQGTCTGSWPTFCSRSLPG
jgi:hypothetical protein